MDQDRNHGKKCSVFKRIKYFLTRQVRMDARLLDFMQEHPEIAPDSDLLEAPPGEFQKILAEMDKRGIKPAVKRQIKLKNETHSSDLSESRLAGKTKKLSDQRRKIYA